MYIDIELNAFIYINNDEAVISCYIIHQIDINNNIIEEYIVENTKTNRFRVLIGRHLSTSFIPDANITFQSRHG